MSLKETVSEMANSSDALDNLYPALVECFAIIICGYLAGRMGLVTEQQHGALYTFVGTFSLPSFIFIKLASLQLSSVNWLFLLSILLSKVIIFVSVIVLTILVTRPHDPSRAGLYAIFCTQSNDFAIGYPIISVLYSKLHPDYVNYLYLAGPINLIMLNPFGFILMELGKTRMLSNGVQTRRSGGDCFSIMRTITWNIIKNPIFFMTVLGLAGNFVFKSVVPPVLSTLLNVFADAFPASALFLLGLRMVGKVQRLNGMRLLIVTMLISTKLLTLPVITREVVGLVMSAYGTNHTEIEDFSTFGFLYGTIPSAPATFVYALSYNLNADLIATAMVGCNFLSGPLMFASARMVLASTLDITKAIWVLKAYELELSIAGIILSIWVIVVFVVNKSYKKIIHRIILCLILSQVLACLSTLIGILPSTLSKYVQFVLAQTSEMSVALWAAVLAASLLFTECQNWKLLSDLQPIFLLLCWGVPVFSVALLMILVIPKDISDKSIESFLYGSGEAGIDVVTLILSFIATSSCLVLYRFYIRDRQRRTSETSALFANRDPTQLFSSIQNDPVEAEPDTSGNHIKNSVNSSQDILNSYCDHQDSEYMQPEMTKITFLLFFMLCSLFISLAICLWRIVMIADVTGVYIELCFIQQTLIRGQILVIFLMFGLDTTSLLQRILKRIKAICQRGRNVQQLLKWDELPSETKLICEKFCSDHLNQCHQDIAMNYWWVSKDYRQCFTGNDLVSWLVSNNLAHDRTEGVHFGNELLRGNLLKQLNNAQLFCDDAALLYCFDTDGHPCSP